MTSSPLKLGAVVAYDCGSIERFFDVQRHIAVFGKQFALKGKGTCLALSPPPPQTIFQRLDLEGGDEYFLGQNFGIVR